MRTALTLAVALALGAVSGLLAGELKSGLQPGESLDAFQVEKVAGAPNDNVDVGTKLCYRCMLGNKPVVMVFSRKPSPGLAKLVKELDQAVEQHADQKLSSFVNLLGDNPEFLKATAKEFVKKNKVQNVAFVVPEENTNGPASYKINPEAETTVLVYREGKVAASHAAGPGQLDSKTIEAILKDTEDLVK